MATFPALPLWTDAYLADTLHLDVVESGAYLHLLMVAWRMPDCALPDDDAKLARWARCSPKQWKRVRETVLAFWTRQEDDDGRPKWVQKRLLKERSWVEEKSRKASTAAKAKALKYKEPRSANAAPEHMPGRSDRCAPIPTPTPTIDSFPNGKGASAPSEKRDSDFDYYASGKAFLGTSAGGLLTKLKRARGLEKAMEILKVAANRENPREYICGVLRANGSGESVDVATWSRYDWENAFRVLRESGRWGSEWKGRPGAKGYAGPKDLEEAYLEQQQSKSKRRATA